MTDNDTTNSSLTFDLSSSNMTISPEYLVISFSLTLRLSVSILCVLMLVIGTFGNLLVPLVVWKNKDMRNSTNVFLVNLSVADVLVLLICVPTVLVEINSKPETWILGKAMCKMVPFLESTVAHGSVLTILAISFERYYAICQPLRAGYKCTKARATIIIIVVWIVSIIVTSPVIVTTEHFETQYIDDSIVPVCFTFVQTFWRKAYFMSVQVCFFLVPLIILIVVYAIMTSQLMDNVAFTTSNFKRGNSQRNIKPDHHTIKARRQVITTLAAVVVSFFVCLLPMKVFQSWIILSNAEEIRKMGASSYFNLLFAARMMLYANSTINPILYNVISSKFREAFVKQVACSKKARIVIRRNTASLTSSTTPSGGHSLGRQPYKGNNDLFLMNTLLGAKN